MQTGLQSNRYISSPKRLSAIIVSLCVVASGLVGYGAWQAEGSAAEAERRAETAAADLAAFKEELKKRPVYINLPGAKPILAIKEEYSQPNSIWVLANKATPLKEKNYEPNDLVPLSVPTRTDKSIEERSVRQIIVNPLRELFAAAETSGHMLMIGSAYRSPGLQAMYFNGYVQSSGLEMAKMYSAEPGHSEHQLGLAVDISTLSRQCYLSECFISTPDGAWLADNAHNFGFHMRYPKGKEEITGYSFEPWHYRYVGVELATALYESGLTLEEAWPHMARAFETLKRYGAI